MKKVMILGAGEMQVPIIQKAVDLSIYTIVIDFDPIAPGFKIADRKSLISTIDYENILIIAQNENIDGILTMSDFPVNVVAKIAEELRLPAMSINVAAICTNKYLQREFFNNHNIKTPKFKLIEGVSDFKIIDYFPVVIKPIDSSASRGVKKVNNMDELESQYSISKKHSKQGKVIVEEFISGREFSIETITQEEVTTIVAITEKIVNSAEIGYFVEDSHIIPARISGNEVKIITEEVINAIKILKINNAPTHTEVKLNETGAYIIEIACRLGGDYITSDLVQLSTGVDMLENLINLALDNPVDVDPKWNKVALIQFLNSNNYQQCVTFVEQGNSAVIRSEIKEYHNHEITSSFDRMGYVILQTNNMEEMEEILSQLNTL
ncbi:MAG: biotin carboxylase [Mariniflexile sp.]|jgi:biotin carboxylase